MARGAGRWSAPPSTPSNPVDGSPSLVVSHHESCSVSRLAASADRHPHQYRWWQATDHHLHSLSCSAAPSSPGAPVSNNDPLPLFELFMHSPKSLCLVWIAQSPPVAPSVHTHAPPGPITVKLSQYPHSWHPASTVSFPSRASDTLTVGTYTGPMAHHRYPRAARTRWVLGPPLTTLPPRQRCGSSAARRCVRHNIIMMGPLIFFFWICCTSIPVSLP